MDNLYSFFREIKCAALVVVLLLFAGIGNQAFAQANNVKPFTKRVGTTNPPNGVFNIRGDYTMIGNTNLTLQNYSDNANNSQNQMIYVDVDGVVETVNSSTAELVFSGENDADPNCSEIIYAGLYWSGRSNLTTDFTFDVTKGLIPGTPIVYSNQNQNFEHNETIGSYQMVISRAGSTSNRRPVYTFSSDQGGDTYTFEVATNDVVTYRIGNGSTITPSNQVISTNTPSNSQTTISFSPVQIVDGDLTITVNSIVRHESDSESAGTYQSSGIVRTVLNGTFIPLVPNTVTLDKRQVKIKGPGDSGYTTLNATNSNILFPGSDQSHMFVGYTDVTAFVKARGLGEYTVADLALVEGNGGEVGFFGQWGIVVVYENTKLPWRDITLFDGYSFVQSPGNGALAEGILPITGFNAVQNGDVNVKLGVMAGEGDRGISGDFLEIEEGVNTNTWRRLVHPLTTSSNFFNSSIYTPVLNSSGTLVANPRFPNLLNNTGIDIAMWNIDNSDNEVIGNSQTSTRFKFGTTQDLYAIYFIAFAVDAYIPDIEGLNQIQEINGVDVTGNPNPTVQPGQELVYKLEIRNKGTEAVENGEIIIPMPFTASFVSSTTQILFALIYN